MTIKSQLTHTRSRCESSCTIARKISHRWGLGRWTFMCCRRGFLLFSHGWASFFAGLLPDNTRNEFDERTRNEKIKEIERQCHWSRAGNTSTSTRMSLNTHVQSVCWRLSRGLICRQRTPWLHGDTLAKGAFFRHDERILRKNRREHGIDLIQGNHQGQKACFQGVQMKRLGGGPCWRAHQLNLHGQVCAAK